MGETACGAAHTGRYLAREEKARVSGSAAAGARTPCTRPRSTESTHACSRRQAAALRCSPISVPPFPSCSRSEKRYWSFTILDDLVQLATRLLSERGLTARLGDAATQRAHRDHTYDLRVTAILEKLS